MNLKPAEPIAGSPALPQALPGKRTPEEKSFTTHDGVELFYRYWPSPSATPKGAILLFHREHEHSGRMAHVVDELDLPGFAFFAWDARGHGRSPGSRRRGQFACLDALVPGRRRDCRRRCAWAHPHTQRMRRARDD